jgi:3-deoxy-D-manno-octulosonic-acid transferase
VNPWWTAPGLVPVAAWVLSRARLRGEAGERLGVRCAPAVPGSIWIHAASLGEMEAAAALARALDGPILLTADSDVGVEKARRISASDPRIVASACPVDHPFAFSPLWADARPRVLIFVEGAFWPSLAAFARQHGVPVLRVSARAGRRTRRWPTMQRLFACDGISARDEEEAVFFRSCTRVPVVVGGDLKADGPPPKSPLQAARPLVVAVSTRAGDEAAVLHGWRGQEILVLAPRQRERWDEVERLLRGYRYVRRSALTDGRVPSDIDVVLLDTLGELAGVLNGARAAFIGGTFDPSVGGHSPAEAIRAGVPVVHGPQIYANAAAFGDAVRVPVHRPDEVAEALVRAASLEARPRSNGAAARTAAWLQPWLRPGPAPEVAPRPWLSGTGRWVERARAVAFRGLPTRLGIPVVSVGGTNARGSGKTSVALWFARELRARGHRVGVVVRGYRRAARGRGIWLSGEGDDTRFLGDEGALFAREGFSVAAGSDRVEGARRLEALGATVIVIEDGLQYLRLHRDVDIAVVDARFPEARGPLPAGERREREAVPARVHGVVVVNGDASEPDWPKAVVARRFPGPWHRGERVAAPPAGPAVAFAGVARPGDFRAELDRPIEDFRVFADHQPFDDDDAAALFGWAGERHVLTTAKDRVRLPLPWRDRVYWRSVELSIEEAPEAWFPATTHTSRSAQGSQTPER